MAGLQPRLAAAAAPTRANTTPHRTLPEAGIRADRAPGGSGWHIEVRCVLTEGRRALDPARNVHARVAAAVIAHLAIHGVAEPVTVAMTGIAAWHDAA
ncbi:hypothetical protein [Streptomyces sp. NPDC017673]|uniref:hypothetical protein n=1 Tax=unclassified Streptomyces TaxID=2593676 RepID=UPI0037A331ED